MSELNKEIDEAQTRLKATAEKTAARVKNPSYHVFVFSDESGLEGWRMLTAEDAPVSASSRKEAIKTAAQSTSGRFLVIPAKEFQPVTRKTRTETIDEFS